MNAGAFKLDLDRWPVAGAPVVMAALWQSARTTPLATTRLIYSSAVRIRRALVPLILVACAALSACGGDDRDDDDDSSAEDAPSAHPGRLGRRRRGVRPALP